MFISTSIRGSKEAAHLLWFCRKRTPEKLVFYAPMTPTWAMSQNTKPTTFTCCLVSFVFLNRVLVTFRYYIIETSCTTILARRTTFPLSALFVLKGEQDFTMQAWFFMTIPVLYAVRIYISKEQRAIDVAHAISIAGELSDRASNIRNTFPSAEVLLESFFHLSLIRNGKLGQLSKFV